MSSSATPSRPTHVRYTVLGLTVVAYLITYMDRGVISAAAPSIQKEFGFSIITMGWILGLFQWGYALFQIPGGWLGDRFGPRRVLSGIVVWWSAFTALTAVMWSAPTMAACRFLFGVGEAGAFPNATRSLSRWMLPAERGFAQGLTHAGARLGGALTPILVVTLIVHFGWRMPFFLFAVVGVIWSAVWFFYYRDTPAEHAHVNAAERDLLERELGPMAMTDVAARIPALSAHVRMTSVRQREHVQHAALWRVLPGPVALKALLLVALLAGVVVVCFEWVFPLVASWLPYDETTVGTDTGASALFPQLSSHREVLG